jgi:hypothetical protein
VRKECTDWPGTNFCSKKVQDSNQGKGAMAATAPGYSGKPLGAKLGIKAGLEIHLMNAPAEYSHLIEPLPEGATIAKNLSKTTDLLHIFTASKAELARLLAACRKRIKPTAVVWVSWPKKAAKVPTDITEDTVRELALPLGFVDIKVCAVTAVWSGLKLVVRKEAR